MADYPTIPIPFPYNFAPPDYKVLRTEFELGHIQTRPITTVGLRTWSFRHESATKAEKDTWMAFWNLKRGSSVPFTFFDPEAQATVNVRFAMSKPQIQWASPGRYTIAVELEEVL